MKGARPLDFDRYFSVVMLTCGIVWFWDYVVGFYFPGRSALNLTLLSTLVYVESALVGCFAVARRIPAKHIHFGVKASLAAWVTNTVFRLILFEFAEALWGVIIYLVGFLTGGFFGGFLAAKTHRTQVASNS